MKLALIIYRAPTLLERLLLGIKCYGFCQGDTPEGIANCHRFCGDQLLHKLGRADSRRLK